MADTPRLKVKYQTEIVPALVEQLGIKNINCVPKLEKIVVNMGVGAAAGDSKLLDAAMNDMRIITGQQIDGALGVEFLRAYGLAVDFASMTLHTD